MDPFLAALRAAAEPTRLRLLALCDVAELAVSELTAILGQSQPRVSRHLKILVEAGLLTRRTEAGWAFYRIDRAGEAGRLAAALLRLAPMDDPGLMLDRTRLEAVRAERAQRAQAYFEANAPQWDAIRAMHVDEAEVNTAILAAAGPARRIIDIGAGAGHLATLFAPQADRVVGVDASRAMLDMARARLDPALEDRVDFRLADMYRLPFGDGAFDLAVIHQVLHFADRPAAVIAEAARLLAPGGRLVIADFAPHEMEALREAHAHRRLGFAEAEIAAWCRDAGLTPGPARALPGDQLTVLVWAAEKSPATMRKTEAFA